MFWLAITYWALEVTGLALLAKLLFQVNYNLAIWIIGLLFMSRLVKMYLTSQVETLLKKNKTALDYYTNQVKKAVGNKNDTI